MKSPLHRCLRAALGLGLASAALLAPATAQGRPDTVYRLNERTGKVLAITGTVLENSLTKVRIDRSGKESSYDASEVVQIDWGSVPPAYRDGMTYRRKGEFAEAVDAFRVAATDASTREVVQADARLKAAETLLQLGASDAGQYQEAAAEAEKLVSDFGESSLVPRARYVIGRALRLSGQDAAAAEALEALYGEGSTDPAPPATAAGPAWRPASRRLGATSPRARPSRRVSCLAAPRAAWSSSSGAWPTPIRRPARPSRRRPAKPPRARASACWPAARSTRRSASSSAPPAAPTAPPGPALLRSSGAVRRSPPRAATATPSCASPRLCPSSTPVEIGLHGPSSDWHNPPWPWATAMLPAPRASG